MGKVNIDLGALFGLLTKTPTAQSNPLYDASQEQPFYDAQTGTYSSAPAYTDAQGNEIPGTLDKGADTTHALVPPTQWQRMVHPEQAGQIDTLNNQFVTKPLSAALENKININTRAGNYAGLPSYLQAPNLSPEEAARAGYGDFSPPTILNTQNRAVMDAQGGVPAMQSGTDVLQAGTEQKVASGEAGRVDVMNKVLDQDTLNHWFSSFKITPEQARLAYTQAKFENNGVEPLREQVRELAMKNQLTQERDLVPAQTQLSLTQTENAQRGATETGELWPYTKTSMDNRAIADAATSRYVPLQEPYGGEINNGLIDTFKHNPLGASPYRVMMNNLQDLNGKSTQEVVLPNGKKGTAQVNNATSVVDPLGGGLSSGAPTITPDYGPPAPTPLNDKSGSMTPPSTNSITTLDKSVSAPLQYNEKSISAYKTSTGEYDYSKYNADRKVAANASDQLQTLLHKYNKSINEGAWYNPMMNKSTATDWITSNAKSMSHGDLKQALTLMHQLPD